MKRFIFIMLAAAMILGTAACSKYSYETVKGDPTATRIYTLDNGLKVYMTVNKDKPRIDAQIAVKVGSKNDPRETTGLAHYFEHLMFKGTEQFGTMDYAAEKPMLDEIEALFEVYRMTDDEAERKAIYHQIDSISYEASKIFIPNEYDKLMASIGASGTNAYTSYDVTCYVENIPSNQIENWAKIQADRFENCVLRGFHTELETIYEEYNMYAAMDQTKASNALFEGLFENHPYNTDVIGLPSHLKNPSITNVKNYHDQWYVPNNMAVVMCGDFDPDKAIKIIDKYFGPMKPNENLERPQFEPEKPIEAPVVKTVLGNESPYAVLAWRFPGANQPESLMLDLLGEVLYNGKAGLIDLDVNQQQKALSMAAYAESLADYSAFVIETEPKPGQSLEEVRQIALDEIEKVKKGEFDESLIASIINNMKLRFMTQSENTRFMARTAVNCFINDESWEQAFVKYIDRLNAVTKDDLVAFVNDNFKDNYVLVNKVQQADPTDTRIAKPQITPIETNRDASSQFLTDMQAAAAAVKPIEPVFVDFEKDMTVSGAKSDIEVLYKKNVTNGTFELDYVFETGSDADKVMDFAGSYLNFLGTSDMSAEDVQKEFYRLACTMGVTCTANRTYVSLSGLAENMDEAMQLMEKVISDAQPDDNALMMLKLNTLQERENAKTNQRSNFSRLTNYGLYGKDNPSTNILSQGELLALSGDQLVEKIHGIFNNCHYAIYYGPLTCEELVAKVNEYHNVPDELAPIAESDPFKYEIIDENEVIIAPFDANQVQLTSLSSKGEKYDPELVPIVTLYNEYFGGGMNSIVFQEMREARGLAYSAGASYSLPGDLDKTAIFMDVIYTQNDKVIDAIEAFDDIINNMPVSDKAFNIAKDAILSNLRSQRTVKSSVLWKYVNNRKLGLDYDINRDIFEKVQNYTLDDIVKFQQENIKDRKYRIMILGRGTDLDLKALEKYGKVKQVSTSEIFGY